MRITAAVVREAGAPFELTDLEISDPGPDEILVRVVASGVCHTDAHVQHGNIPTPLPAVFGHEGAGVVERTGASVRSVQPGDHVVLTFQSCGRCRHCLNGDAAYCALSYPLNFGGGRPDGSHALRRADGGTVHDQFFGQSSFATYAITTERNTVKVPADLPLDLLAPLGCGIQTGAGAVLNALALPRGASIAVFGTGAVGLSAVMAARAAGLGAIIGVDINPQRLELARELGATHTLNPRTDDIAAGIKDITGSGADAVLDLTGRTDMIELGVTVLGTRGTLGLIGSPAFDAVAKVPVIVLSAGSAIRGIVQGESRPQLFIPELIGMYRDGAFPFDRLVRYYDFADVNTALADAGQGTTVKPVLRMPAAG